MVAHSNPVRNHRQPCACFSPPPAYPSCSDLLFTSANPLPTLALPLAAATIHSATPVSRLSSPCCSEVFRISRTCGSGLFFEGPGDVDPPKPPMPTPAKPHPTLPLEFSAIEFIFHLIIHSQSFPSSSASINGIESWRP